MKIISAEQFSEAGYTLDPFAREDRDDAKPFNIERYELKGEVKRDGRFDFEKGVDISYGKGNNRMHALVPFWPRHSVFFRRQTRSILAADEDLSLSLEFLREHAEKLSGNNIVIPASPPRVFKSTIDDCVNGKLLGWRTQDSWLMLEGYLGSGTGMQLDESIIGVGVTDGYRGLMLSVGSERARRSEAAAVNIAHTLNRLWAAEFTAEA